MGYGLKSAATNGTHMSYPVQYTIASISDSTRPSVNSTLLGPVIFRIPDTGSAKPDSMSGYISSAIRGGVTEMEGAGDKFQDLGTLGKPLADIPRTSLSKIQLVKFGNHFIMKSCKKI